MKVFRIATSKQLNDDLRVVGDKCKVVEDLFWQQFESKVREITSEFPEKYEETLQKAKESLYHSSLTIIDTWFQITNKK
jgi:hypothetical protein